MWISLFQSLHFTSDFARFKQTLKVKNLELSFLKGFENAQKRRKNFRTIQRVQKRYAKVLKRFQKGSKKGKRLQKAQKVPKIIGGSKWP